MSRATTAQTAREAWTQRGVQALVELSKAEAAPALFKPERVAELQQQYERARSEVARWDVPA